MTVSEWFEGERITREDVDGMGEESDYSRKAAEFIGQKWNTDVEDLTEKQSSWASRIIDDMIERRCNRRYR